MYVFPCAPTKRYENENILPPTEQINILSIFYTSSVILVKTKSTLLWFLKRHHLPDFHYQ